MAVLTREPRAGDRGKGRPPRDTGVLKSHKYNKREAIAGYLFISPWILGFLVFTLGAMAYSLYISFSYYNLAKNTTRPAGLANYQSLIEDPKVTYVSVKASSLCAQLKVFVVGNHIERIRGYPCHSILVCSGLPPEAWLATTLISKSISSPAIVSSMLLAKGSTQACAMAAPSPKT